MSLLENEIEFGKGGKGFFTFYEIDLTLRCFRERVEEKLGKLSMTGAINIVTPLHPDSIITHTTNFNFDFPTWNGGNASRK